SEAFGVSGDGNTVVGFSYTPGDGSAPFRWTQATGIQNLGFIAIDPTFPDLQEGSAYAASYDGSVIVGWSTNATESDHAFRWTAAGGMVDLGYLGSLATDASQAMAVNSDGSIVVGGASVNAACCDRAFRWTQNGTPGAVAPGMQDLTTLLANAGVNM